MARTNFSGPINEGNVQSNNQGSTTTYKPGLTRNVGFVVAGQSFWLDHNAFTITGAAATNVAAAAQPASGNMTLTADAATIGTTILPAINGYGGAAQVTITSVADDSGNTMVITGTDVYGLPQTESLVMADSTTTQSVKTWASITDAQVNLTSSGDAQQPAGNVSIGVIATDKMTVVCQSTYNGFPGVGFGTAGYQPNGSYGSIVESNYANNIVIPKNSRIMNISLITVEDPGQTAAFEFGANLGQSSTTDTHDLNYFTTTSGSLKAVGQYNLGGAGGAGGLVPDHANCYNTSYGDTNPYAADKLVTVTCDFGAAITAGELMINFTYLQGVNGTN